MSDYTPEILSQVIDDFCDNLDQKIVSQILANHLFYIAVELGYTDSASVYVGESSLVTVDINPIDIVEIQIH